MFLYLYLLRKRFIYVCSHRVIIITVSYCKRFKLMPGASLQHSYWVCGHSRAHQHAFKMTSLLISVLFLHSSCSSFLFFIVFALLMCLNSSPSWMHNRRIQPWRLCPLCSRYTAFLTSMEASWWDPSLHCRATRGWWLGSSPTALESPRTGKRAWKW